MEAAHQVAAPVHSGIAVPRFVGSGVVGRTVCRKRPRRFVDPINLIRDSIIRESVHPFDIGISIICFTIGLISHC
jgi:hypothetical protein